MSEAITENKKRSLILAVGAAVLLIGGGIAAYWAIANRRFAPDVPLAGNLLPKNALMAISVSTDQGQWEKLRSFGTKESQALFDKKLAGLRDRLLAANGYDYERDIEPWVGSEVMMAFLPPTNIERVLDGSERADPEADGNLQNPGKSSVVMVLPIDKPRLARETWAENKGTENAKWVDRTYKAIDIKEMQNADSQANYAASLLGERFLAIANSPEAMERTIDTYLGEPSLVAVRGYEQAWQELEAERSFAKLYVNVPVAAAVAATDLDDSASEAALIESQRHQGLATAIALEPEGIRFRSVAWLRADKQPSQSPGENKVVNMPNRLPAETLIMMSGGNLQKFWQDYAQGAQSSPIAPLKPEWLRTAIQTTTKLDLEKDLLSWMAGEFSLALIPASEEADSKYGFGLLAMVEASDRRAGEEILKKLDGIMQSQYRYKVEEGKIGELPVTNWVADNEVLIVTHGWLEGNIFFLNLGAPVASTIVPNPKAPLGTSPGFAAIASKELASQNGSFFLDVERTVNQNLLPGLRLPPEQKTMVDGIRAIAVTAAASSDRSTRYEVFVRLKSAGQPQQLPPSAGN